MPRMQDSRRCRFRPERSSRSELYPGHVESERTARSRGLAKEMGVTLGEAYVGGGSDGNFTAALGVPTLDGLGAVGEGAHSPEENVVIRALAERAALIASLLATI